MLGSVGTFVGLVATWWGATLADLGLRDGFGVDDLAQWIAILGGATVILGGIWKMLEPLRDLKSEHSQMREDVRVLAVEVAAVKAQVLPNHGTSMRDRMDTGFALQDVKSASLAADLAEVKQDVAALVQTDSATNRRIDAHLESHSGH